MVEDLERESVPLSKKERAIRKLCKDAHDMSPINSTIVWSEIRSHLTFLVVLCCITYLSTLSLVFTFVAHLL